MKQSNWHDRNGTTELIQGLSRQTLRTIIYTTDLTQYSWHVRLVMPGMVQQISDNRFGTTEVAQLVTTDDDRTTLNVNN